MNLALMIDFLSEILRLLVAALCVTSGVGVVLWVLIEGLHATERTPPPTVDLVLDDVWASIVVVAHNASALELLMPIVVAVRYVALLARFVWVCFEAF